MTESHHMAAMLASHLLRRERLRESLLARRKGWGPRAMENICIALRAGLVNTSEVMAAHHVSEAELDDWIADYDRGGADALYDRRPRRRAQGRRSPGRSA